MKPVRTRIMRPVNKIGPRKLKSLPFLEAQNVYPVKDTTTAEVKINASSTILPTNNQDPQFDRPEISHLRLNFTKPNRSCGSSRNPQKNDAEN